MFTWLWRKRSKRQFTDLFGHYVSADALDAMAKGTWVPGSLKEGNFAFVVAHVQGVSADEIAKRVGTVTQIAHDCRGCVMNIFSSFILITFGTTPHYPIQNRSDCVGRLLETLRADIRIIHGDVIGHVGDVGSPTRRAYTVVIPGFSEIVAKLCALPYGEAHEQKRAV